MKKDIFVDFDGTICPNKHNIEAYPPPTEDCITTLRTLKELGYKIVIYSVRSNLLETLSTNGHHKMINYLKLHSIPYDEFISNKPHFSVIIDDKCLGCPLDGDKNVKWGDIKDLLSKRGYM